MHTTLDFLTGCSSSWDEFRTSTNRLACALCCHRLRRECEMADAQIMLNTLRHAAPAKEVVVKGSKLL
eukprot:6213681-Pleurochrysis_carterae.AAC.9